VVGPALVSIAVGVIALTGLREAMRERARAGQSRMVIMAIGDMLNRIREAQSIQRDYALTGDPGLLARYSGTRQAVQTLYRKAMALETANTPDANRLQSLQPVEAECFRLLDSAMAARQRNPTRASPEALTAAFIPGVQARIDSIEAVGGEIERDEEVSLRDRVASEERQLSRLRSIVAAGLALAVILAVFANVLLARASRTQTRAIAARDEASKELEEAHRTLREQATAVEEHAGALEAERSRLLTVLEQSPLAIAIAEVPGGRVFLSNRLVTEILGSPIPGEGLARERQYRGFHMDGRPYENDEWPLARAIRDGEVVMGEIIGIERRDGTRRIISVNAAPVRDASGRTEAAVAIFSDVTEQQRAAESLRQARHDAEAANRAKSEFLAVVSHELRTPLSAIIGYAELLADGITGPVSGAQREQLGRITASAQHLLQLIDDILTMSRIEAGREVATPEPLVVRDAVEEAAGMAQPLAAAKGLTLRTDVEIDSTRVRADPVRFRQILLNLLSNAVKFSDHGEIVVTARKLGDRIAIDVRDEGIGIAPEDQERVFDAFWQVEQQTTRRAGGAGLGLSVTRRLARLMGGEVTVSSGLGKGSTFTVTLPQ